MVVYGQGDYTLTLAEASQPPSSLPNHVSEFGFLSAKAIVQEGESNLYGLESAYDVAFTPSGASIHNELSGLQGGDADEYYHINSSEYSTFQGWFDGTTNITVNWFNGLFNWTVLTNWFSFDGATLSFNDTKLNLTINAVGNYNNWSSTYNISYAGSLNNASYLSTYNVSYDGSLNNASYLSTYNVSYDGSLNNASYLSTYNATYDTFNNNGTYAKMNYTNIGNFNITGDIKVEGSYKGDGISTQTISNGIGFCLRCNE